METNETKTLYLRYDCTSEADDVACLVTTMTGDAYEVAVRNPADIQAAVAQAVTGPTRPLVAALLERMGGLDRDSIGTVEETGWYESARINWADPAASTDHDGGLYRAEVRLDDGLLELLRSDVAYALDDWSDWDKDRDGVNPTTEAVCEKICSDVGFGDAVREIFPKVLDVLPKVIYDIIADRLDGADIKEE